MRSQAPLSHAIPKAKKPWDTKKKLLAVGIGLYVVYIGFLGVSTIVDSIRAAKLTTDIATTRQNIDDIYNKNAEFALYMQNKGFLDSIIVPTFSAYLEDMGTKIPDGTRTQSIQITQSVLDDTDTYTLNLVLESIPPLREISKVLDTLSGSAYFDDVAVASATVNTTTEGVTTFSYPISMTINPTPTDGNNSQETTK